MARVTVEDCIHNVENRFDLVMTASRRARQIANGAEPLLDEESDKPTVIALREIAEDKVDNELLDKLQAELDAQMAAAQAEVRQEPDDED